MNKLIIFLTAGVLVTLGVLDDVASDGDASRRLPVTDTVRQLSVVDTSSQSPATDTTATAPAADTAAKAPAVDTVRKLSVVDTARQDTAPVKDTVRTLKDSTAKEASDWVKDSDTAATAMTTPKAT